MAGYTGSDVYEYLTIGINSCNQTVDPTCDTANNIVSYLINYTMANDYYKVKLYVVDTIVTPSNSDAISRVL